MRVGTTRTSLGRVRWYAFGVVRVFPHERYRLAQLLQAVSEGAK